MFDLQRGSISPEELEAMKDKLLYDYDQSVHWTTKLKDDWELLGDTGSCPVDLNLSDYRTSNQRRASIDFGFDRSIDQKLWRYFFTSLRLQTIMSKKATDEFHEKMDDPEPFTAMAARQYMANVMDIVKDVFENLIKDTFEHLITTTYRVGGNHCRYDAVPKSRNNMKVEKSCRLSESIYPSYGSWDVSYQRVPIFDDLEKVCYLLDGEAPPEHPDKFNSRINMKKTDDLKTVGNPYFTVTLYLNGNQLVKFNPDKSDVLDKLNKYGQSGNMLGVDVKIFEKGFDFNT